MVIEEPHRVEPGKPKPVRAKLGRAKPVSLPENKKGVPADDWLVKRQQLMSKGKPSGHSRELGLDLAMRGLERQSQILGDLRSRTGTVLAAAGVVTSVLAGVFAGAVSAHDAKHVPKTWTVCIIALVVVGAALAALGACLCLFILKSLHDDNDSDLDAWWLLRHGVDDRRPLEPSKITYWALKREHLRLHPDTRTRKQRYREWRVTLNSKHLAILSTLVRAGNPNSDPNRLKPELLAETTSFLDVVRQSNFKRIAERTRAFDRAIVLFGVQTALWLTAFAIYAIT